ncbi:serine carboxypeptidase-like 33 [Dorcoceras hygrometricum]|uniref:Serine carboxypeptidase-like 33 n=1 Tax=Dorcoceras hygrometricum TaxID=472368 RepID=A0A2Z7BC98_9LAMI|nr:serine carboxypeptidase-like 33 [Dorcoceras hygrometricum]
MHENKATTERREPKGSQGLLNKQQQITDQMNNSGHGVCEYMGATHSSQHTAPDAQHSSTCCCPTHEVWELPTPLIAANRSQQGDEVRELPAQPQQHPDNGTKAYTTAHNIHAQFYAVKQAHICTSILLCYNYCNGVPSNTNLTHAKPKVDNSSGTEAQNTTNWEPRAKPNMSYPSNTTEGSKQSTSSELNLLHLPFFRNEKYPLEDFDYNNPRCNPLRRPSATRTPSHTTAHQPASCVCLTHFFTASVRKATLLFCLSAKDYTHFFNVSVQKTTRLV